MAEARVSKRLAKKRERMESEGVEVPWKALMSSTKESDESITKVASESDDSTTEPHPGRRKRSKLKRRGEPNQRASQDEDQEGISDSIAVLMDEIFTSIVVTLSKQATDCIQDDEFGQLQAQIREEAGADLVSEGELVLLIGSLHAIQEARPILEAEVARRLAQRPLKEEVQRSESVSGADPDVDLARILQNLSGSLEQGTIVMEAEVVQSDGLHDSTETNLPINQSPPCKEKKTSLVTQTRKARKSSGSKLHKCTYCEFYTTKQGRFKHIARMHKKMQKSCEICKKTFGFDYELRRHSLIHFDKNGNLKPKAQLLFAKNNPEITSPLTLTKLELDRESEYNAFIDTDNAKEESDKEKQLNCTKDRTSTTRTSAVDLERVKSEGLLYGCPFCNHQDTFSGQLTHSSRRHSYLQFKCNTCHLTFTTKDLYGSHLVLARNKRCAQSEGDNLVLQCTKCDCHGPETEMLVHMDQKHTLSFKCLLCEAVCDTEAEGKEHYVSEHSRKLHLVTSGLPALRTLATRNIKSEKFTCTICFKTLAKSRQLNHMSNHDEAKTTCQHCGLKCLYPWQVKDHIRKKHEQVNFFCDQCGSVFKAKSSLLFHVENCHNAEGNKVSCKECGRAFTHIRFLKVHMKRVHQMEKKYFCSVCNRGFYEKVRMKEHTLTHLKGADKEALKKYACKHCDKRFMKAQQVQQHENMHTGHKPYKCKKCDMTFTWASDVYRHMGHHSEDKPFACGQCGKSFKFRFKLASHMAAHLKRGPHTCSLCNRSFPTGALFKQHDCFETIEVMEVNKDGMVLCSMDQVNVIKSTKTGAELLSELEQETADTGLEEVTVEEDSESVTFMCAICQLFFGSAEDIDTHFEESHPDVSMVMKTEEDMEQHIDASEEVNLEYSSQDATVLESAIYEVIPHEEVVMSSATPTAETPPKTFDQLIKVTDSEVVDGKAGLQIAADEVEVVSTEMKEIAEALTDLGH